MRRDNINYVLVGTLVLAALLLLLVALAYITGRHGASADYLVRYRSVTGLRDGAPVFYQGYRIGQVGGVEPERSVDGTRYKVTLRVRRDWPIPADSVARLQSSGLLADVSIGIREGTAKQVLTAGSELKGEEGVDVFGAMNDLAAEVTALTRSQIAPLVRSLGERVDSIAGSLDQGTPQLLDQSRQLLERLNAASVAVNDLLRPENRAAVSGLLADLREVSRDLHTTQARLDQALTEVGAMAKENRPAAQAAMTDLQAILAALSGRIDAIVHHLDSSSRNLDEFSREIRKNPNRLLLAPKADKVEDATQ